MRGKSTTCRKSLLILAVYDRGSETEKKWARDGKSETCRASERLSQSESNVFLRFKPQIRDFLQTRYSLDALPPPPVLIFPPE